MNRDYEIIKDRNKLKWCIFEKPTNRYINLYSWLTTNSLYKEKLGNIDTPIASFFYHKPSFPLDIISDDFLVNNTWICKSYLSPHNDSRITSIENTYYYKMGLDTLERPPIPKFLLNLYRKRNKST